MKYVFFYFSEYLPLQPLPPLFWCYCCGDLFKKHKHRPREEICSVEVRNMMPSGRILNISFPPFFFPFWEISFIHWQRHLNRYFLTEAFIPLLWEGKPCILLAKLSYNVSAKPKEIWVFKELFQAGNIRHWEWELLSGSCLGDKFPWQTAPEDNSETQGGLSGCLWQNAEGRVQDKRNLPSASQQAKIPQRGKASSTEISSVLLFRSRVQSTASVC